MLIMVFSSVQAAVTNNLINPSVKCPMSDIQMVDDQSTPPSDSAQIARYEMGHNNNCHLHPQCSAHINLISLLDSNQNQLALRLPIRNKLISNDELVVSIYHTLYKRPPKV
jgi:hypothetical protein